MYLIITINKRYGLEAAWETESYAKTTGKAMPHDCGISFRLLKERKKCLKLSIKEIAKVNHVKFMVMIILKTLSDLSSNEQNFGYCVKIALLLCEEWLDW